MTNILEKLFGSAARVKIIRFFFLHPNDIFTSKEIVNKCKISSSAVRREILLLKSIGFIKKLEKKKIEAVVLNEFFPLLNSLRNFVVDSAPGDKEKILKSLKKLGKIKLIIISGIFLGTKSIGPDLLLVGDGVRQSNLEKVLKNIELTTGKEIVYGLFDTKEFLYRLGMNDKFILDILDFSHEKLFDKLNV